MASELAYVAGDLRHPTLIPCNRAARESSYTTTKRGKSVSLVCRLWAGSPAACLMDSMGGAVEIIACDPSSPDARAMSDALWEEIQQRYGFTAPNPFEPVDFAGPVGGFWVAVDSERKPVGSVAVTPLDPAAAELDVMYVAPEHRRAGVARLLLAALESHCRSARVGVLRLRAGEPQPEALRFYTAAGFVPIPPFGKWVGDDTARCFEKSLT